MNPYLVAEEGGLIGYILLEQSEAPVPISASKQIECVRLFVDKAAQGQYLGSKLLEEARRISEQDGYETLWLKSGIRTKRLLLFMKRRGSAISAPCLIPTAA